MHIHKALLVTPAMAAGLTSLLMTMEDVVALIDVREAVPQKRGPHKKKPLQISN